MRIERIRLTNYRGVLQHEIELRGGVTVIDERSGAIVRTISVGGTPDSMSVDERTGRVFVADSGGVVIGSDPWQQVPAWVPRQLYNWLPFLPRPGSTSRVMPPSMVIIDEAEL